MINLTLLLTIFIILELFESTFQKSDTFYGVINKNYQLYKKNIFLFFSMQPSFYYTLFLAIYLNNFSFWMSSIVVVKFLDIYTKLYLLKKIDDGENISEIIPIDMKIKSYYIYLNVILYPLLFIIATLT